MVRWSSAQLPLFFTSPFQWQWLAKKWWSGPKKMMGVNNSEKRRMVSPCWYALVKNSGGTKVTSRAWWNTGGKARVWNGEVKWNGKITHSICNCNCKHTTKGSGGSKSIENYKVPIFKQTKMRGKRTVNRNLMAIYSGSIFNQREKERERERTVTQSLSWQTNLANISPPHQSVESWSGCDKLRWKVIVEIGLSCPFFPQSLFTKLFAFLPHAAYKKKSR